MALPKNIESKIMPVTETGCWLWLGCLSDGYGMTTYKGKHHRAHRIVYSLLKGAISAGLTLDHLCRTKSCVNPDHLEPVSQRMNVLRGDGLAAKQAKQTHCKRGHPFDETNTYFRTDGNKRRCRTCQRGYSNG